MVIKNSAEMTFTKKVQSSEIILSVFFAANHIPFRIIDQLVPTLQTMFKDLKTVFSVRLGCTKLTNILKNVIGKSVLFLLSNSLKKSV